MICENCYISSQLDALGRYLIDKNQGKNFFEITDEYMHANNEYSCCSRCDNKLEIGEWIYENEESLFKELGKLTAKSIHGLEQYVGSDIYELVEAINANIEPGEDPDEKIRGISEPTELGDVIKDLFYFIDDELLNNLKDGIFDYLDDYLFDLDEVNEDTQVLTKSDNEYTNSNFYGIDCGEEVIESLDDDVSDICKLTDDELNLLKASIVNDKHRFENKILNKLKEVFKNQSSRAVLIKKNKFYRARVLDKKELECLKDNEQLKKMALTPPLGISSQGRWSKGGIPTSLYVSNKYHRLPEELVKDEKKEIVIFALETNKERNLMPIPFSGRFRDSKFYKKVSEPVDKGNDKLQFKQQYALSNLLSESIRDIGYDGIIYDPMSENSSYDYNSKPMNFAIFDHYIMHSKDSKNFMTFDDITVNNYFIYKNKEN
ncbi:hypothetical protein [Lactobacillus apis]|uniref:hypothetical protein n=1 Tax=Lactobacillus apis TaxID=303541 RepID=UPI00242D89FB|nr:hypothetical protein [Lactobacillus apis]